MGRNAMIFSVLIFVTYVKRLLVCAALWQAIIRTSPSFA